ncbi:hypothetical protein [Leifsonia poae]
MSALTPFLFTVQKMLLRLGHWYYSRRKPAGAADHVGRRAE